MIGVTVGLYQVGQRIMDPAQFPLRHVRLEGELRNLDQSDLHRLVQNYLGQSFFRLDIMALHETFMSNAWVKDVGVRRVWPDSIEVSFKERVPFGRWGETEMVDVNGTRFQPDQVRESRLWPELVGPDGHEQIVIQAYREASMIVGEIGLRVERLVENERRAWWLILSNGITLNLGREHFNERLRRFVAIYPKLPLEHVVRIETVDLRYSNGFAVRWKTASSDSPS